MTSCIQDMITSCHSRLTLQVKWQVDLQQNLSSCTNFFPPNISLTLCSCNRKIWMVLLGFQKTHSRERAHPVVYYLLFSSVSNNVESWQLNYSEHSEKTGLACFLGQLSWLCQYVISNDLEKALMWCTKKECAALMSYIMLDLLHQNLVFMFCFVVHWQAIAKSLKSVTTRPTRWPFCFYFFYFKISVLFQASKHNK